VRRGPSTPLAASPQERNSTSPAASACSICARSVSIRPDRPVLLFVRMTARQAAVEAVAQEA
jgi:hypothetical protein